MSHLSVVWHDLECGSYAEDLALWKQLAAEAGGPILDLGCGTGRVGLHLARSGREVLGIDVDEELVGEFNRRAAADGLQARALIGNATRLAIGTQSALILAPMQLAQLLAPEERGLLLAGIADHLEPGGTAALAIIEPGAAGGGGERPLPDVREEDGWVYSSLPVEVLEDEGGYVITRLRQTVSPGGELSEEVNVLRLHGLSAELLAAEAASAGLDLAETVEIAASADHVGSTALVFRGP